MAKYLFRGSYSMEGAKGLVKEGGSSRREVVEKTAAGLGGSVEAFYYAFGDDDVIVIADLPNHAAAAALSLNVGASGAVHLTTTPLMTPEEIDDVSKVGVEYRPPGA